MTVATMTPSQDFVRLVIDKNRRIKLRFRHAELRKAVIASGNRSIEDLSADAFGGWAYLIMEGARPYKPEVTVDMVSGWIDDWVNVKHPETGEQRTLKELGDLLIDALKASKMIVLKADEKDKDKDDEQDGAEGNE